MVEPFMEHLTSPSDHPSMAKTGTRFRSSMAPSLSLFLATWMGILPATLLASALPYRSEFLVQDLEAVIPAYAEFDGDMYAGLIPMTNKNRDGKLMFWLFAPRHPTISDSLVMWLNGGPGCSSFGGGLFENMIVSMPHRAAGYCCLSQDEPLVYNSYSWTNASAMIYLEQPVGVGFSYGNPEPVNEDDVSGDVYAFLRNFFAIFDEFRDSRFFIFGESYAGMYAPSIAHRIYKENQKLLHHDNKKHRIHLAGVGLGNGWVDARVQGPMTIDYAYWHGMLDTTTRDQLHAEWEHCMSSNSPDPEPKPFHKFTTPDDCSMMTGALMAAGAGVWPAMLSGPNTYDVTTWDPYNIISAPNSTFERFYNDPRVRTSLHVPHSTPWHTCLPGGGRRKLQGRELLMLQQDQPISTIPYVAELLDHAGIRVLVYNGDRDLSTCAQGSEQLLNNMNWSGAVHWPTAHRGLWIADDQVAGYSKEHVGLSFLVVYNSGHLVPFNVPGPALDLVTRFVQGESFRDRPLTSFQSIPIKKFKRKAETKEASIGYLVSLVGVALLSFVIGFKLPQVPRKSGYETFEDEVSLTNSHDP